MRSAVAEEILCRLIGIPSISGESNLPLVEVIETYLADAGITSRRILSADASKASILATIGPDTRPGIVLSAHTDVVPATGQAWSTPPFRADRRDGRIFGRGASDMKGFQALVLARAGHFRDRATGTPVHFAFSYDEELACQGAPDLVNAIMTLRALPVLCIVGEPTEMQVVRAHKGKIARRVVVTGRGGHSAMPHRAANAVSAAAAIPVGLERLAGDLEAEHRDPAFDPPFTTVHVGSLHGGDALNLVPDRANLAFEVRLLPAADVAAIEVRLLAVITEIRASLQCRASEARIVVQEIAGYPALSMRPDERAVELVIGLLDERRLPGVVSFGTEAGLYAAAGVPMVVCGPGSITRAHKADEWIRLDELKAGGRMLDRLAAPLAIPIGEWDQAAT